MKAPPQWVLAALALCTVACGSGRRSEPLTGAVELATPDERAGQRDFFRFCHQCHPNGDAGLGPAINNKPLPDGVIRLQVRAGAGAMPSFPESVLSDRQVDAIVAYLNAVRKAD